MMPRDASIVNSCTLSLSFLQSGNTEKKCSNLNRIDDDVDDDYNE